MYTLQVMICLLISLTIISTVAQAEDAVELNMVVNRVTDSTYQPSLNFQSVGIPNVTHFNTQNKCSQYFEMKPCPTNATNIRYYEEVGQESLKCLTGNICNNSVSLSDTMYLSIYRNTPATTTLTISCNSSYRLQINESDYERNVKLIMERNYSPPGAGLFKTTVTVDGLTSGTSYWNSSQQHRIRCVPDVSSTQPGIATTIGTKLTSMLSVTSVTTTTDSNNNGKQITPTTGGGSGGQTGIKDKIGLIIGLPVSFLVLTVIINLLVILIRKRCRKSKNTSQKSEDYIDLNLNSAVRHEYDVLELDSGTAPLDNAEIHANADIFANADEDAYEIPDDLRDVSTHDAVGSAGEQVESSQYENSRWTALYENIQTMQ